MDASLNLKLFCLLKPLSGFSDSVFQEETVWEVGRDDRCLLSSSIKGLDGVRWSVLGREANDARQVARCTRVIHHDGEYTGIFKLVRFFFLK